MKMKKILSENKKICRILMLLCLILFFGLVYIPVNVTPVHADSKETDSLPIIVRGDYVKDHVISCKYGLINHDGEVILKPVYDSIDDFSDGLAKIKKGGKYGYVNADGEVVAKPVYTKGSQFNDGYAVVKKKGKWGIINEKGEEVVKPIYDMINSGTGDDDGANRGSNIELSLEYLSEPVFSNGLVPVEKDGKWGFVNTKGKVVIKFIYEDARPFSEGLAAVYNGDKWGYINKKGKWVIKPAFSSAYNFSDGFAEVFKKATADSKWDTNHLINKKGKVIAETGNNFSDGLNVVMKNGKYGYINTKGKVVIACKYENALSFSNGVAMVEKDGKWGLINKKGKTVIKCKYDFNTVDEFDEDGFATVEKNGKYGFVNAKERLIVKPVYDSVSDFSNGFAIVIKNGKWGLIDTKGKTIVKPGTYSFKRLYAYPTHWAGVFSCATMSAVGVKADFSDGLLAVKKGGKWGFINAEGKIVIKPVYDYVYAFSEGLAAVKQNGKWGFINTKGEMVIEPVYDDPIDNEYSSWSGNVLNLDMKFSNGVAMVCKEEELFYINTKGEVLYSSLFPPEGLSYDHLIDPDCSAYDREDWAAYGYTAFSK